MSFESEFSPYKQKENTPSNQNSSFESAFAPPKPKQINVNNFPTNARSIINSAYNVKLPKLDPIGTALKRENEPNLFKKYYSSNPTPYKEKPKQVTPGGKIEAFAGGVADTVTLGLNKKLTDKYMPESFKRYEEETEKAHPITSTIGQMAGYAMPATLAEKGAGLIVKGAGLGSKLIRGSLAGGSLLGTESAIRGNNIKQVAKDTAIGAVLGVGGELVGHGVGKLVNKIKAPKELPKVAEIPTIPTKNISDVAKDIKDISGYSGLTDNIYRVSQKSFGKNYGFVKERVLDPLYNSKLNFVKGQEAKTTSLMDDIVKKFNIRKGSKDSGLIQDFGENTIDKNAKQLFDEGKISKEELKAASLKKLQEVAPKKWQNIVEADRWFRTQYDNYIDEVNKVRAELYPNNSKKIVPKREDYYRHFKDFSDSFTGIKNVFETPAQISPSLSGISEFTKPNSKFAGFMQKRGLGKYKSDAIGGFLDYIKAAEYAKHIDPQIKNIRTFAKEIAKNTEDAKNANGVLEFLQDYANDLAGKTNPLDRLPQKFLGRKLFNFINVVNQRTKINTILGNISSSLSQIANVPQGIAFVKNPKYLTKGASETIKGILGDNPLYKKSQFISERYSDKLYRQFDQRLIDQPRKLAEWMLSALDEVGTKYNWNSIYQKAITEGIPNPIQYADEQTMRLVGGRGVGEMPLAQKSKLAQIFIPFTYEVANLWKVQKDFIKAKDFAGMVALFVGNYAINRGMEQIRGSAITFDPIKAIQDAYFSDEYKDKKQTQKVGRLVGEVVSNIPLGQMAANMYPEFGSEKLGLPTRKEFFGRSDPTRFGTAPLIIKSITDSVQDPKNLIYNYITPFGGKQLKKTIEGVQSLNKEGVYDKNGDQLAFPIEKNISNTIKGTLFGKGGFNESLKGYKNQVLSKQQTEKFNNEVIKGKDQKELYNILLEKRKIDKEKNKRQEEIKEQFPLKKDYLKKYDNDSKIKELNKLLKDKKFNWLKEN